jgi:AcrR family transcriptional regulator
LIPQTASHDVRKGQSTRAVIVTAALRLAEAEGLEGLSIGRVADLVGMSKSGVFAHFGAREDLLLAVLEAATVEFANAVFVPAVRLKRGIVRLRAVLSNACRYYLQLPHGCVILSAAHEFDDKPCAVRDAVQSYLHRLRSELVRAISFAVDAKEMAPDVDTQQLAFECFGIFLGVHHELKALRDAKAIERGDRAIARLLQYYAADPAKTSFSS